MTTYEAPQLTVHGSVADITDELGNEALDDTIFNTTGEEVRGVPPESSAPDSGGGSRDATIIPG